MTHRYIKIGGTVTVLLLAFGGLLWSTLSDGTQYFKDVDEVMADRAQWEAKSLRLHGYVVPGSILENPNTMEYRFKVQNNGHTVDASYKGIVPDTFKDEAEVVLSGKLTPAGFLTDKNGVTAKCPSKYVEQASAKKAG